MGVQALKGPSTLCQGDPDLELPTLIGGTGCSACFVPADWRFAYRSDNNAGNSFVEKNEQTMLQANSENIAYNLQSFWQEFPELIDAPLLPYEAKSYEFAVNGPTKEMQFCEQKPLFLPYNAQNSCTDSQALGATGEYPQTAFSGVAPEAPNSEYPKYVSQLSKPNSSNHNSFPAPKSVPKIVANALTYNLGPINGVFYGNGWSKGSPAMLINCAFLASLAGDSANGSVDPAKGFGDPTVPSNDLTAFPDCSCQAGDTQNENANGDVGGAGLCMFSSTSFQSFYTNPGFSYPNLQVVLYNFITDGVVPPNPPPNVFIGSGTFIDKHATLGDPPLFTNS